VSPRSTSRKANCIRLVWNVHVRRFRSEPGDRDRQDTRPCDRDEHAGDLDVRLAAPPPLRQPNASTHGCHTDIARSSWDGTSCFIGPTRSERRTPCTAHSSTAQLSTPESRSCTALRGPSPAPAPPLLPLASSIVGRRHSPPTSSRRSRHLQPQGTRTSSETGAVDSAAPVAPEPVRRGIGVSIGRTHHIALLNHRLGRRIGPPRDREALQRNL
jgi:hypothetical protein